MNLLVVTILLIICTCHGINASYGEFPQIFLIGAQKCGSTSLHDLLSTHPNICQKNGVKEAHFFNTNQFKGGKNEYMKLLAAEKCGPGEWVVDGTPNYIQHDVVVPQRLLESYTTEELKRKKFVLVLREPVRREFSLYEHMYRCCLHDVIIPNKAAGYRNLCGSKEFFLYISCKHMGCFHMNSEKLKSPHPDQYFKTFKQYYDAGSLNPANSNYMYQLRGWLKHIPQQQIFIVNFETLVTNTTDVMKRLQQFFGFSTGWGDHVVLPHDNEGDKAVQGLMDCETHDKLWAYYNTTNAGLIELINSPNRSIYQPYFPPFKSGRSKCVNV